MASIVVAALLLPSTVADAARPQPSRFLSWNAHTRVAHLTLLAGLGRENGGFNFDGYGRGELLVRIPLGWRVSVTCQNRGGRRYSCAVVHGSLATRPAFPGASTPDPTVGLPPGGRAAFTFVASRRGTYRIACLVPGDEQARMWDVLDVVEHGPPTIAARPGP